MDSASDGGDEGGDLIDNVYQYLSQKRYRLGCTEAGKRVIRRKAEHFVLKDVELYFKRKQKGKVSCLKNSETSRTREGGHGISWLVYKSN